MTYIIPVETPSIVPEAEDASHVTLTETAPSIPADVVPPEIARELPPHTEVRLVYWLRREYWTKLITPIVAVFEEREAQ